MDLPVSAFAVYNSNKPKKKKKPKSKSKYPLSSKCNSTINDSMMIKISAKLNKKGSKKKLKNKAKKKIIKQLKKNSKVNGKNNLELLQISDSDDIPDLIPGPNKDVINGLKSSTAHLDECSNLSNASFEFMPVHTDSSEEAIKILKWMIAPYKVEEFFNHIWEKKPLHIAREKPLYYKGLISTPIIDTMLRNENIQFTKNIDITSYVDGKRETHNPEGRAHPHLVWDFYLNGCSLRLLNPQTYISHLHLLNATLQEYFHSFVGANAYLTPPDSQGFAPHYDDIEAFILQTEGKKHWRIYKPRDDNEILPRVSSKNFTDDEIGEPIMEVTLEAGDMLYFPRGYIHQGVTIDGQHSLHVTISMYQKHSWADLFEKMLPAALQLAVHDNVELRYGLPFDIYDNFGLVHSDCDTPRKKEIKDIIFSLFDKLKSHLPLDEAVDQMAKHYQRDALPPVITDLEKAVTVYGDTDIMVDDGKVINRVEISLDTKIRLLRKNIIRMVSEDSIRLYYYVENSLEYHGSELPFLEIEEDMAPGIETLITSYPEYIAVENLDLQNDTDKLQIADALWSRGLIMTECPLENIDDE
ncbi:unnamed protein product [Pieris brassicae]|uniref:Bifunctional lysine-specific demethylase and histidyl-hydroxylase n=1 Tax=Pieris brassicae TaxID=7116 RepID=A0A9P0TS82_PIEBR|nr:unnamed protein product [Pieris brassicae]